MNTKALIKTAVSVAVLTAAMFGVAHYKPDWSVPMLVAVASGSLVLALYSFFAGIETKKSGKAGVTAIICLFIIAAQTAQASPNIDRSAFSEQVAPATQTAGPFVIKYRDMDFNDPSQPPENISFLAGCVIIAGLGAVAYIGMRQLCKSAGIWPTNQPPPPPPPNINTNQMTNNPATNQPPKRMEGSARSEMKMFGQTQSFCATILAALVAETNTFPYYVVGTMPNAGDYLDANGLPYHLLAVTHIQASANLQDWHTECSIYVWNSRVYGTPGLDPAYVLSCTAVYDGYGNLLESVTNSFPVTAAPGGMTEYPEPDGSENQITCLDHFFANTEALAKFYRVSAVRDD
jgi:hypothetical protein